MEISLDRTHISQTFVSSVATYGLAACMTIALQLVFFLVLLVAGCHATLANFAETLSIQGGCAVALFLTSYLIPHAAVWGPLFFVGFPLSDLVAHIYGFRRLWARCGCLVLVDALANLALSERESDVDIWVPLFEGLFYLGLVWLVTKLAQLIVKGSFSVPSSLVA